MWMHSTLTCFSVKDHVYTYWRVSEFICWYFGIENRSRFCWKIYWVSWYIFFRDFNTTWNLTIFFFIFIVQLLFNFECFFPFEMLLIERRKKMLALMWSAWLCFALFLVCFRYTFLGHFHLVCSTSTSANLITWAFIKKNISLNK